MSEANVAIVRGMFEDVEAYLGACDPDIEFDGTNLPDGKILRGLDAVVDFDAVVRDPQHPDQLLLEYDCGDHLHPSPAGYKAMGNAVPLALFAQ